ncbi:MAG: sigma-54 dependent transcriptional regulator [Vicinamibacteria bacterium]|nr:sigma-54 dependent transcriptional regulator [Vicinamibacteria bacterium]
MPETWSRPLVDRTPARLRRARAALAAGRPTLALASLGNRREGALLRIDALAALGRGREALATASRALNSGPLAPDLAARLRIARAEAHLETGRVAAAEADLRQARALAAEPRTLARLALTEARCCWRRGEPERAGHALATARDVCGREHWSGVLAAVHEVEASLARDAGRLADCQDALTRRIEVSRALGREDAVAAGLADRGELLAYRGGWQQAAADLQQAAEIWRRLGDPRAESVAGLRLASVRLAQGDLQAARAEADRARAGAGSGLDRGRAEVLLLEADLALAFGQPAVSEAEAAEAARVFAELQDREGEARARVRHAQALLARGAVAAALRDAERAGRLGRRRPDLVMLAEIARGRALLHAGRPAEAAFERALAAASSRPAFRAVAALGLALGRGLGPEAPEVRDALVEIEAWGDRRILAYVRADLRIGAAEGGAPGFEEAGVAGGPLHGLLGRSEAMRTLCESLPRYARASGDVHVSGETGTGKEQVAQALHALSGRRGGFVAVSAAELHDGTLHSTLFGHVRGAYTDAHKDRAGLVERAEGGTLFIDEVQDLSPRAQGALLRFLQERRYERFGDTQSRAADVRVVTASNVPLADRVARGELRADVMHRLHQLVLELPPLRERGDDLLLLARAFLKRFAASDGRACPDLSAPALAALRAHPWPGNVRELMNVMRQALVDCPGPTILREHLPRELRGGGPAGEGLAGRVARLERAAIAEALARFGGNQARAARLLGLSRQGLARKLQRLGC